MTIEMRGAFRGIEVDLTAYLMTPALPGSPPTLHLTTLPALGRPIAC